MGPLLLVFLTKFLSKFPSSAALLHFRTPPFQTPHLTPWRISSCAPALRYCSFCKILDLKCLKVFWIHLCLDNCSVIYTVTLILNSAASHVQNSGIPIQHTVFSGMPECPIILYSVSLRHMHIETLKAYIQHPL